jgi:hypothetical protein
MGAFKLSAQRPLLGVFIGLTRLKITPPLEPYESRALEHLRQLLGEQIAVLNQLVTLRSTRPAEAVVDIAALL